MNASENQPMNLHVSDVMTENVIEIPEHETMANTADILRKSEVSGAPVVDDRGRCVGIISGTDFVEEGSATRIEHDAATGRLNYQMVRCNTEGLYYIEEISADDVDNRMSTPVETIASDATLAKAAQAMCKNHIHRLIVVGDEGQPVGVLSSLDILRALFYTTREGEEK